MQKSTIKRNLLIFVLAAIAVITACVLLLRPSIVYAEGNNAGSSGFKDLVTVKMDVNGKDAVLDDGKYDSSSTDLAANDENSYRVRTFQAAAFASELKMSGTWTFVENSIIVGSNSIDVESVSTSQIKVTALSINTAGAYFSVKMASGSQTVTVYVCVEVNDTFVQLSGKNTVYYVGNSVDADGNETSSSCDANGKHAAIYTIDNYSNVFIDLGDLLLGRALYDGSTAVTASSKFWTLKSVSNFTIETVTVLNASSILSPAVISNPTNTSRVAPSLSCEVSITSKTIGAYAADKGSNFFDDTHDLQLTLKEVNNRSDTYTINIPVKFNPANPSENEISSSYLRLNVTSDYVRKLNLGSNSQFYVYNDEGALTPVSETPNDYSAIIITPSDLIDYASPSDYRTLTFNHEQTTLNGSADLTGQDGCRVEIEYTESEEFTKDNQNYYPLQYKITALKSDSANNSFTVKFVIDYEQMEKGVKVRKTMPIELAIETYGGYTIEFNPINGKKAATYNALTSEVFSTMRRRGYMLQSARSNDTDVLTVSFSNNVLTLDPQVEKINGRATATVNLTFINNNNQTITFDSEVVSINVNAGSLFARFEDWQAWLIIAACILGGIIIILLIVWLFIRAISKRREAELATQAPVSSYIVKLNSTIAATQVQQRMAQTQALSQASNMLLGAGPTNTAAPTLDTLQLASGFASTPGSVPGAMSNPSMSTPGATPLMSEPQAAIPPEPEEDLYALIAKYITDDELLERIFTEKYEPKGMVRRTFFKSKDLQTRELEKEKKRIIDRYKTPMPMDEAIMSETEIKNAESSSSPTLSSPLASEPQSAAQIFILDFNPDDPLFVEEANDEFSEEKIDIDASPEETALKNSNRHNEILIKELAELKARIGKVEKELNKAKTYEEELREKIGKAEADDAQYAKEIEDLEFSLASAKNREKDRITRDIGIKEEKKQRNADELERLRAELDALLGNSENLNGIMAKLQDTEVQKNSELTSVTQEVEKAQKEFDAYKEHLAKVQARQELEQKVTALSPLLQDVNNTNYELRRLDEENAKLGKERDALKSDVAVAKSSILGATDFDVINDLNTQISDANARLSEIEKEASKIAKRKSNLGIEFNAQRRKANDFIAKNEIPVEDVVNAENAVLGNIELELHKAMREKDKEDAERAVATAQAVYDDLAASDSDITFIAMEVASNIKAIEEDIEAAQAELEAVNEQMETASDDERLMLIVEQGDKTDKIEELKAKLEQENIDGAKRKMEAQGEYDTKLEDARRALDDANNVYNRACMSFDELISNTNPLDLIIPGSGIISQDQKKLEAENLKKQLERSKNEIEQARLAAQQAQEAAEQARIESERAAEEARLEAERTAQEAMERAEQARIEAEEKARADIEAVERAKQEAAEAYAAELEEARRKAQEAEETLNAHVEEAERLAQEEAEEEARKAQEEAEEAERLAQEKAEEEARKAQEEAEEAARKAQEEAEEAILRAQEDAEEAQRKAQEEAEEAKRKAQEDAEEAQRKAQEEIEEAKRKAQEEIEEMRRKAEEDAEAKRLDEENKRKEDEERQKAENERKDAVDKKIAARKDQIVAIRNEMKDLKGDEDAKNLRERLYNIQLSYDEDERGSVELMDFYNKTMDDIQNSGEIARLKAENAKKPQRVVRKVTERVNRIAKRRPASGKSSARPNGARSASGARAGARPASGARAGARPAARPASRQGARPASRPGARPGGNRPTRPR